MTTHRPVTGSARHSDISVASPARPEGVDVDLDARAGGGVGDDPNDVEPRRPPLEPVPRQVVGGHHRQPSLFLRCDRRRRIAETATAPGLDLYEDDALALTGHPIDLAESRAITPGENAVTAGFEGAARRVLARRSRAPAARRSSPHRCKARAGGGSEPTAPSRRSSRRERRRISTRPPISASPPPSGTRRRCGWRCRPAPC